MLARVFEEAGLSTVALALIRNHAERAKPPRALFVPFPLGFALGRPNDPELQHRVLAAAFGLLDAEVGPVLADFEGESDAPAELLQASDALAAVATGLAATAAGSAEPTGPADAAAAPATPARTRSADPADELTALRGYYESWVAEHDGRTMVALTGVPQRRWRGLVRALQAFADGGADDVAGRPPGVPVARFVRYAADDLKAFYFEARMARRPDQRDNDLQRWFWAETAMGRLLARVAERMTASGDPDWALYARGIAR